MQRSASPSLAAVVTALDELTRDNGHVAFRADYLDVVRAGFPSSLCLLLALAWVAAVCRWSGVETDESGAGSSALEHARVPLLGLVEGHSPSVARKGSWSTGSRDDFGPQGQSREKQNGRLG